MLIKVLLFDIDYGSARRSITVILLRESQIFRFGMIMWAT